jgi:hypothetical protein
VADDEGKANVIVMAGRLGGWLMVGRWQPLGKKIEEDEDAGSDRWSAVELRSQRTLLRTTGEGSRVMA